MRKYVKPTLYALGVVTILGTGAALAATHTFTADVKFSAPLMLTEKKAPNFGILKANTPAVYNLSTTGVVTTSGFGSIISSVGAQSGQLTISGSTTQTIDISALNYQEHKGVSPSDAVCAYNGGAPVANCAISGGVAPGAGKTLLVGLTIETDGAQADASTASPSFDVNVVYN